MTTRSFDPRPWNLIAGLVLGLAPGCGDGAIGASEGQEGSDSSDADTLPATTQTPPECVSNSDCSGYGYVCRDGVCEYYGYDDGHLPYDYDECFSNADCPKFELCGSSYCIPIGSPPGACDQGIDEIPLVHEGDEPALALSFVDIDDDGDSELVIATKSNLRVISHDSDTPTLIPRAPISPTITAMVGGDFDGVPGGDLTLLVDGALHVYPADGAGGFAAASVEPAPLAEAAGMLVADFDGQSPSDRLLWGPGGALVDRGQDLLSFTTDPVNDAAAFGLGTVNQEGTVLLAGERLMLRSLDANFEQLLGSVNVLHVAAVQDTAAGHYVEWRPITNWTWFTVWNPYTLERSERPIDGAQVDVAAGDLDGDTVEELILLDALGVTIWRSPHSAAAGCSSRVNFDLGAPGTAIAVGDHDGDGDDELAVRADGLASVAILDAG